MPHPDPTPTDADIGAWWDRHTAPALAGVAADAQDELRARYIRDVRNNPTALAQLAAARTAPPPTDPWTTMIRTHERERIELDLHQAREAVDLAPRLGMTGHAEGWQRRALAAEQRLRVWSR